MTKQGMIDDSFAEQIPVRDILKPALQKAQR
jgi:hypothetical protein